MRPILQRLIFGWTIIFFGSIALVALNLFYYDDPILFPKWRAVLGLTILTIVTSNILIRNKMLVGFGLASGIILLFIELLFNLFFDEPHPMHQYAAVRYVNSDGFINSDEVYLRNAPVVKMIEKEGSRKSREGGWFGIERYLYSPRIGLLQGKSLGEGRGSPNVGYELNGIAAWLFGIRSACEEFAFFSINLTPVILIYALYCHYKQKPPKDSLVIQPLRALFLLAPFCLGLIPILGT